MAKFAIISDYAKYNLMDAVKVVPRKGKKGAVMIICKSI
jgi:hypothetical protein